MKDYFKFLLPAVSDDQARKSLNYIQIHIESGRMCLTAANAFIIKRITGWADIPDGDYYLSGDDAKKMLKLSGKNDLITLTESGAMVGSVLFEWSIRPDDISYPNLESFFQYNYGTGNQSKVGLNIKMLTAALKYAPTDVFKFDFNESAVNDSCSTPVRISYSGFDEYKTIVMPVRVQW